MCWPAAIARIAGVNRLVGQLGGWGPVRSSLASGGNRTLDRPSGSRIPCKTMIEFGFVTTLAWDARVSARALCGVRTPVMDVLVIPNQAGRESSEFHARGFDPR